MNIYLTIITTVLVVTQIIRITQNFISLKRQEKEIKDNIKWIGDVEIQKEDVKRQRYVYQLLEAYLEKELGEDNK